MKATPGPPKKPAAIEALQGHPGHRPENGQAPVAPLVTSLEPPVPMAASARALWNRIAPVAQGMGTLTLASLDAHVTFCRLLAAGYTLLDDAEGSLTGTTKKGGKRTRPAETLYAAIRVLDKAWTIGQHLGFTPASISKLVVTRPNADTDPLEKARTRAAAARARLRLA